MSDMTISGWNIRYSEIRKEFGYSQKQDLESAWLLDSILRNNISITKLKKIISAKSVFVIGASKSLSSSIPVIKKFKKVPIIVADSALQE